jgi:hypothetical protein
VTLYEATFLHKKSKTLIVTDCVAYVPRTIPVLQTPEKLLLVGKRSTDDPQPPDTFENRVAGWKKMALLVTYFFPEHEELVRPGLVEWSDGWEENFDFARRASARPAGGARDALQPKPGARENVRRPSL